MEYDIILITADEYFDHPSCAIAMIKRVLEDKGYSIGVISKPNWKTNDDFKKLGKPKLFFGITGGVVDSMMNNYTPLKKKRSDDEYANYNHMPDRVVQVYCNKIKELFKGTPIVLGGIESSLRRFAHYDYWQNRVRKSILIDTRADILVYGPGLKQIIEISKRIKYAKTKEEEKLKPQKPDLANIEGTCIITKKLPENTTILPTFEETKDDNDESKRNFCKMQLLFSTNKNVAQQYDKRYVLQYKQQTYTTQDLDYYYGFDYSRIISKDSPWIMAQFSITTHWGCIGNCNFCSINLLQDNKVISRSEESILNEIKKITQHPNFHGIIDNLGGASANMYGMDCYDCNGKCITCDKLDRSHKRIIQLMKKSALLG